jgi:hypothetical protein
MVRPIDVVQAFLQLVLPLAYHIYHHLDFDSFLYGHKFNTTCAFLQHLSVEHVVFLWPNKTCLLAFVVLSCHIEMLKLIYKF